MAISNRKIGYSKGGVSLISLYTDIKDVGGSATAFPVQIDGKTLYAKLGDVTHKQSSALKLSRSGVKCLLLKASTMWNFKDLRNSVENAGVSYRIGDTSINLKARYKDYDGTWQGNEAQSCVLLFEFDIPKNAKNIKVSMSYNCTQGGFGYDINLAKDAWRGGTYQRLLQIGDTSIEKFTIEKGKETDYWENPGDSHIIPGKYSRGVVSTMLSAGAWYGLEFRVDGTDLTANYGTLTVGEFVIEFEEN